MPGGSAGRVEVGDARRPRRSSSPCVGVPRTEIAAAGDLEVVGRRLQLVGGDLEHLRRAPAPAAALAAPPTITALRLPPVPGPNGADAVSPWTTVTSSTSTPSSSATTWAIVVSRLWPWLPLLMSACTLPLTPMRTIAASVAMLPMAMPDGSTYRPSPTPSSRPSPRARGLLGAERVVVDHLGGLLERLRRSTLRRRPCPAAVVYGRSASLHDVAAAQLERVDAELAGDVVDHLLARRRSRSSTGRGTSTARRCWCRRPCAEKPTRGILYGPGNSRPTKPIGAAAGGRERRRRPRRGRPRIPRMRPSASSGDAHRHPVVAGVLAGHQVLAPVLDPLHRPAEALAGERRRRAPRGS